MFKKVTELLRFLVAKKDSEAQLLRNLATKK